MRILALLLVASQLFAQTTVINGWGSGTSSATVPTKAGTGFSSFTDHPETNATIADSSAGILLFSPDHTSDNMNTSCIAAPATPYTITVKVSLIQQWLSGGDSYGGIGWRNSSNGHLQLFGLLSPTVQLAPWPLGAPAVYSIDWSTPTSSAGSEGHFLTMVPTVYLQIKDDGINIAENVSFDGVGQFPVVSSTAKSSSYLGASGYTNVCLFLSAHGSQASMTVQSYSQTSP